MLRKMEIYMILICSFDKDKYLNSTILNRLTKTTCAHDYWWIKYWQFYIEIAKGLFLTDIFFLYGT